jgi:hypothetical protein
MKCPDVRAALPLLIYGDVGGPERAALTEHLAGCAACRREKQALESVRGLLGVAPLPPVQVDLPRLYQSLAARQARSVKRWRRAVLALGAVAALLLFFVGLRLEVRLGPDQLVVSWGEPPPAAPPGGTGVPPVQFPDRRDAGPTVSPEMVAELQLLRELVHALKQDADDRDQRFAEHLDRLQRHVQVLQAQADQRWNTTEQDVAALYLLTRKGENP